VAGHGKLFPHPGLSGAVAAQKHDVGKQGGFHKPVLHQDKRHRGADDNRQQKRDPTLVAVAVVLLWQGTVSYFRIPAFLVPSPLVMLGLQQTVLQLTGIQGKGRTDAERLAARERLPDGDSLSDPRRGGGGAPVAGHGKLFPHPGLSGAVAAGETGWPATDCPAADGHTGKRPD
jgi:hypothetical protein